MAEWHTLRTVADLVAELQKYPPDGVISILEEDGDPCEVESRKAMNSEWRRGRFDFEIVLLLRAGGML